MLRQLRVLRGRPADGGDAARGGVRPALAEPPQPAALGRHAALGGCATLGASAGADPGPVAQVRVERRGAVGARGGARAGPLAPAGPRGVGPRGTLRALRCKDRRRAPPDVPPHAAAGRLPAGVGRRAPQGGRRRPLAHGGDRPVGRPVPPVIGPPNPHPAEVLERGCGVVLGGHLRLLAAVTPGRVIERSSSATARLGLTPLNLARVRWEGVVGLAEGVLLGQGVRQDVDGVGVGRVAGLVGGAVGAGARGVVEGGGRGHRARVPRCWGPVG